MDITYFPGPEYDSTWHFISCFSAKHAVMFKKQLIAHYDELVKITNRNFLDITAKDSKVFFLYMDDYDMPEKAVDFIRELWLDTKTTCLYQDIQEILASCKPEYVNTTEDSDEDF